MSNMNEGAKKDRRLTRAEREESPCTKAKQRGLIPSGYWEGMNSRDETDPCSRRPVGHGITEGFRMSDPNYDGD